ncbi:MAG: hypothetical protein U0359_03630 [Byssovorax sp.]
MKKSFSIALASLVLGVSGTAEAGLSAPRYQINLAGDFAIIGQPMGTECAAASGTAPPVVGTIGNCGISLEDAAIDVYWRADSPGVGQAEANLNISADQARTTANLTLPAGATVTKAFLYWAARIDTPTPQKPDLFDAQVTLDRQGGFSTVVNAYDHYEFLHINPAQGNQYAYDSIADVTAIVQANGSGPYRLSNMQSATISNLFNAFSFAGWYMVVIYQVPNAPVRNIAVYDNFDFVGDINKASIFFDLKGYFVPQAGKDGKLGLVAFGGDDIGKDDGIKFAGNTLSNALNPADNFFNGTRSYLGAPVSNAGDLPRLTGGINSNPGLDIDVVDVTPFLSPGDSSTQVNAFTGNNDGYFMAGVVTSIVTSTPDFVSSIKTAADVNGGLLVPGDVVEYTIIASNTGNDDSANTVVSDVIPAGMTFVPGSIQIVTGANAGSKTDAAGDDQAEYDPATHKVTVRVGAGASAAMGGSVPLSTSTTVKFKVTVDANALGNVDNQAVITAGGLSGAPPADFLTDGNGLQAGVTPTTVFVDQCAVDADCPMAKHHCVTGPTPNVCVQCLSNADCAQPTPTCDLPSNTCGCVPVGPEVCGNAVDEDCDGTVCQCDKDSQCGGAESGKVCSASNTCIDGCRGLSGNGCPLPMLCTSMSASIGQCVGCLLDSNCGAADSGKVCDDQSHMCEDGCRGQGGNGCMLGSVCTSANASVGQCVACLADADCGGPDSAMICDAGQHQCEAGCRGQGGNGCPGGSVCSSLDATPGVCVECVADADCGSQTSGKICDPDVNMCKSGCRGSGGNGCPSGSVCTSKDQKEGTCVACLADADCGDAASGKICDAPTKTCKDGCRGSSGNGCPNGSVCTSADQSVGKCVNCLKDADCGDDKSGKVCNTATKTCIDGCRGENGNGCPDGVTCTSANATIGKCGCASDADCGDDKSGKVCDAAKKSCVEGCRGSGGNGCSGEQTCSSTDTSIGTCKSSSDDLVGQGHGIFCSTRPGDDRSGGAPWLFGGALALGLALRRRRR